jgi:hypothetical protein
METAVSTETDQQSPNNNLELLVRQLYELPELNPQEPFYDMLKEGSKNYPLPESSYFVREVSPCHWGVYRSERKSSSGAQKSMCCRTTSQR